MTGYATTSGVHIAYDVSDPPTSGAGRDLLLVSEGFISFESMDELPSFARCLRRLRSIGRLIRFDRRGVGLSDPFPTGATATLDDWVDDAIAVLDAASSDSATVIGSVETAVIAMMLAAAYPDRVNALVLINVAARATWAPGYEIGYPREVVEALVDLTTNVQGHGQDEPVLSLTAPSVADDPTFVRWWERAGRVGASPSVAQTLLRLSVLADVRAVLPSITCPTLVVHRAGDRVVSSELSRYVAEHVADGQFIEVPGDDNLWVVGDTQPLLDEIERFVTGALRNASPDRVMSTILFTDIVSSTETARELGDSRWREVLDAHDAMVRRQLHRYDGREIKTTGDGFLATFRGPARAALCAMAVRQGANQLGIAIRAGIHVGEVELRGVDIAGVNVNAAARVASAAGTDEILATEPVVAMLDGTDIDAELLGEYPLRGFDEPWRLFRLG